MTNTTPTPPPAISAQVSINDSLPTSSPSPRSTLIGIACIVAVIAAVALVVIYYQVTGL